MNKKIEVPGGFQTINTREAIKKMWNRLKAKGQFARFKSYEEWEAEKYKKEK